MWWAAVLAAVVLVSAGLVLRFVMLLREEERDSSLASRSRAAEAASEPERAPEPAHRPASPMTRPRSASSPGRGGAIVAPSAVLRAARAASVPTGTGVGGVSGKRERIVLGRSSALDPVLPSSAASRNYYRSVLVANTELSRRRSLYSQEVMLAKHAPGGGSSLARPLTRISV